MCVMKYEPAHEILVLITYAQKPPLTVYSMITPLEYYVFENIMTNGAFVPKEQMLHFP